MFLSHFNADGSQNSPLMRSCMEVTLCLKVDGKYWEESQKQDAIEEIWRLKINK